ncbi:alkaline phosphodiesterase-like protein [Fowlpox virus]|nr:alkaline phosphodiesterase-like protein [Fowlpox virus]
MEDYGYQSDNESCNDSDYALCKDYSIKEEQIEKTNIFNVVTFKKRKCTVRDIILYSLAVIAGISLISIPLCLVFKSTTSSYMGCISFRVSCPPEFERPPLILIAMDGFKYSYLEKWVNNTPNINELIRTGVKAPMRPVFPTNTFPNLYSIVTGLYPVSHGIVNNEFIDRLSDTEFTVKSEDTDEVQWYKGDAIWTTAMKQGVKSAAFFWPGSDKVRNNKRPTMFREYNQSVSFNDRVETVLKWLKMDKGYKAYLYTIYFEEPGVTGLAKGPDSEEIGSAIKKVDDAIGKLMLGLKEMNLIGCANIILVSDHGMSKVDMSKVIYTKELIKEHKVTVNPGSFSSIRPKDIGEIGMFNYKELISDMMMNCSKKNQSFIVDFRSKLPKRLHYSSGFRVDLLGVYLQDGWQFTDENNNIKYQSGGIHGGDNMFPDMTAIFIGYGPAFLDDITVPIFDNIELYNVMCEIIGIKPSNNNGTRGSLNHILRNPASIPKFPQDITRESSCNRHSYTGKDYGCYCNITRNSKGNKKERASTRATSYSYNLPFGKPSVSAEDDYCVLKNDEYVTAYSKPHRSPIWTSFTLSDYNITELYNNTCYIQDMRIMYHINLCRFYKTNKEDISFGFLFPVSDNNDNIQNLFETNTSPMYKNFKIVWEIFMRIIVKEYIKEFGDTNVMIGPVFDNDSDGKRDSTTLIHITRGYKITIPTDYFIILTSCSDKKTHLKDCFTNLKINAFVLPNSDTYYSMCNNDVASVEYVKKLLNLHRTRVTDIELLTGMSFYRDVYKKSSNISFLKTYLP